MLFHKLEYIYIGKYSKYMHINLEEAFEPVAEFLMFLNNFNRYIYL